MMIHSATVSGNLEDVTADETALYFLRISQFWIIGIGLQTIMNLIFRVKTKRLPLVET